jgi:hypothetical protein
MGYHIEFDGQKIGRSIYADQEDALVAIADIINQLTGTFRQLCGEGGWSLALELQMQSKLLDRLVIVETSPRWQDMLRRDGLYTSTNRRPRWSSVHRQYVDIADKK